MDKKVLAIGGLAALFFLGMGKKKSSAKSSSGGTSPGDGVVLDPGTGGDGSGGVDLDLDESNGGGGGGGGAKPKPSPGQITADEKKWVDFYYNLGFYKLQQVSQQFTGIPAELANKGNKSDADWLTSLSYWGAYVISQQDPTKKCPWKISEPNSNCAKAWLRMNAYAKTLKY